MGGMALDGLRELLASKKKGLPASLVQAIDEVFETIQKDSEEDSDGSSSLVLDVLEHFEAEHKEVWEEIYADLCGDSVSNDDCYSDTLTRLMDRSLELVAAVYLQYQKLCQIGANRSVKSAKKHDESKKITRAIEEVTICCNKLPHIWTRLYRFGLLELKPVNLGKAAKEELEILKEKMRKRNKTLRCAMQLATQSMVLSLYYVLQSRRLLFFLATSSPTDQFEQITPHALSDDIVHTLRVLLHLSLAIGARGRPTQVVDDPLEALMASLSLSPNTNTTQTQGPGWSASFGTDAATLCLPSVHEQDRALRVRGSRGGLSGGGNRAGASAGGGWGFTSLSEGSELLSQHCLNVAMGEPRTYHAPGEKAVALFSDVVRAVSSCGLRCPEVIDIDLFTCGAAATCLSILEKGLLDVSPAKTTEALRGYALSLVKIWQRLGDPLSLKAKERTVEVDSVANAADKHEGNARVDYLVGLLLLAQLLPGSGTAGQGERVVRVRIMRVSGSISSQFLACALPPLLRLCGRTRASLHNLGYLCLHTLLTRSLDASALQTSVVWALPEIFGNWELITNAETVGAQREIAEALKVKGNRDANKSGVTMGQEDDEVYWDSEDEEEEESQEQMAQRLRRDRRHEYLSGLLQARTLHAMFAACAPTTRSPSLSAGAPAVNFLHRYLDSLQHKLMLQSSNPSAVWALLTQSLPFFEHQLGLDPRSGAEGVGSGAGEIRSSADQCLCVVNVRLQGLVHTLLSLLNSCWHLPVQMNVLRIFLLLLARQMREAQLDRSISISVLSGTSGASGKHSLASDSDDKSETNVFDDVALKCFVPLLATECLRLVTFYQAPSPGAGRVPPRDLTGASSESRDSLLQQTGHLLRMLHVCDAQAVEAVVIPVVASSRAFRAKIEKERGVVDERMGDGEGWADLCLFDFSFLEVVK